MKNTFRILAIVAALFAANSAAPVRAQDVGPALDPGQVVGTMGIDAVRQSEEARAAKMKGSHRSRRHHKSRASKGTRRTRRSSRRR